MTNSRILYISDVNASEPLFHSQVLSHIAELRKYYSVDLIGLSRGEISLYDFSYNSIKGDYVAPLSLLNFLINKKSLYEFIKTEEYQIIYSRGYRGGLLGSFIKKYFFKNKIHLVNDVRGDALDEHKESFFRTLIFKQTTRVIFRSSDTLFFVSTYLRKKYYDKFKFNSETGIYPTFVPDSKFTFSNNIRLKYREKLGYKKNDIVLLYSGNLAKWQNVSSIINGFGNSINKNLRLLILTKDQAILKLIESSIKKNYIKTFSVDYKDIQDYYFASDYCFLIREDIDTNRCSAPTKFSEYLNSGLILITTDIKSDYIDFLKESGVDSILMKNKNEITDVLNSLESVEKRVEVSINKLSQIVQSQSEYFEGILNKR